MCSGTHSTHSTRTDKQAAGAIHHYLSLLNIPISSSQASKLLKLQTVADCIELHSGLEHTGEGVMFHLSFRLKAPVPQGTKAFNTSSSSSFSSPSSSSCKLPPPPPPPPAHLIRCHPLAPSSEVEAGRWYPLWTCDLSASAHVKSPLAIGQQPELKVICQRYRGKPGDVGLYMYGHGFDNGMAHEQRIFMRKTMDGFGAAFGGHILCAGQTPTVFNMLLRKTGPGNAREALLQAWGDRGGSLKEELVVANAPDRGTAQPLCTSRDPSCLGFIPRPPPPPPGGPLLQVASHRRHAGSDAAERERERERDRSFRNAPLQNLLQMSTEDLARALLEANAKINDLEACADRLSHRPTVTPTAAAADRLRLSYIIH